MRFSTPVSKSLALAVVLSAVLVVLWNIRHHDPVQSFADNFDANLQGLPVAAEAARDDPALRAELLRRTTAAFKRGGWDAANTDVRFYLKSALETYADDAHVVRTLRAYLDINLALEAKPELCKAMQIAGSTDAISTVAAASKDVLSAAVWDAVRNGLERKRAGAVWHQPDHAQIASAVWHAERGPFPLSEAESRASRSLVSQSGAKDALAANADDLCRAEIKSKRNLLALSQAEAAMHQRVFSSGVKNIDWLPLRDELKQLESEP